MSSQSPRQPAGHDPDEAFRQIYEKYYPALRSWAVRQYGPDGEDLAQEAFTRLFKRRGGYDWSQSPWSWLVRTTRNLWIDAARRNRTAPLDVLLAELLLDPEPSAHDEVEARERRAFVAMILRRLKPRDLLVLRVRHIEGRSTAELAAVLGVSDNAARQALSRACNAFRREYRLLGGGPRVTATPVESAAAAALTGPLGSFLRRVADRINDLAHDVAGLFGRGDAAATGAAAALAIVLVLPAVQGGSGGEGSSGEWEPAPTPAAKPDERRERDLLRDRPRLDAPPGWRRLVDELETADPRAPQGVPRQPPGCRIVINSELQTPCEVRREVKRQVEEIVRTKGDPTSWQPSTPPAKPRTVPPLLEPPRPDDVL